MYLWYMYRTYSGQGTDRKLGGGGGGGGGHMPPVPFPPSSYAYVAGHFCEATLTTGKC